MSKTKTETEQLAGTLFAQPPDLIDFEAAGPYGDWRDEFHKYGCVVIKNVISKERAEYYQKKQLEWLHNFELGFDENDSETWTADHLPISFKGGQVVTKFGYLETLLTKIVCILLTAHAMRKWLGRREQSLKLSRYLRSFGAQMNSCPHLTV
jgi:hypothetical protein